MTMVILIPVVFYALVFIGILVLRRRIWADPG